MGFRRLPEVCGLVVQTLVALGGNVPAEIALHAVTHEVLPVFLVVVASCALQQATYSSWAL